MISGIARFAKGSFSRNPRRFCTQSKNNGNDFIGGGLTPVKMFSRFTSKVPHSRFCSKATIIQKDSPHGSQPEQNFSFGFKLIVALAFWGYPLLMNTKADGKKEIKHAHKEQIKSMAEVKTTVKNLKRELKDLEKIRIDLKLEILDKEHGNRILLMEIEKQFMGLKSLG